MGALDNPSREGERSAIICREESDRLFVMLETLFRDAGSLLAERPSRIREVEELAGHVAEIRRLLLHLSRLPMLPGGRGMPHELSRYLAARYEELEGRVKELRNDIVRSSRSG